MRRSTPRKGCGRLQKRALDILNDPRKVEQIRQWAEENRTQEWIQGKLGLWRASFRRIKETLGLRFKRGVYHKDPSIVPAIKRMSDEGVAHAEIARRLGLDRPQVAYVTRTHRIKHPSWSKSWTRRDYATLRRSVKAGKSFRQICKDVGRGPGGVKSMINKLGLFSINPKVVEYMRKQGIKYQEGSKETFLNRRLASARRKSQEKGRRISIGIPHLLELLDRQNGRCYYTGREMTFKVGSWHAVSIDRINSDRGYIEGNVVLCTWMTNQMKMDIPQADFIKTCALIAKTHG